MIESWRHCKNILVIRADNMGDLIMSGPALRALKESSSATVTLLTSSLAAGIAPFIKEIDEVLVFDLPWVKANKTLSGDEVFALVALLKERDFDAAVIFTVFSQNPLPAAMVAFMAGIPLRLAYCRENPYSLLTNWLPDKEPYSFINHQVERDLSLVHAIGAATKNVHLHLELNRSSLAAANNKLEEIGVDTARPWLILHAGVSEEKRRFPEERWVEVAKKIIIEKQFQILFTGTRSEKILCDTLAAKTGPGGFSVAGLFSLDEFIALVKEAPLVVSVNTGTVHIAAAVDTPVIVLYAQTNPQHTPWRVRSRVLEFGIKSEDRSKNEVIQFLYQTIYRDVHPLPLARDVYEAVNQLLHATDSFHVEGSGLDTVKQ
jgi:lipopolysaccharide heptosyltransferase II